SKYSQYYSTNYDKKHRHIYNQLANQQCHTNAHWLIWRLKLLHDYVSLPICRYNHYCATLTNAGLITRSPSMYPFCTTSITCPLSKSSLCSCEIASWNFGSNSAPAASIRLMPSTSKIF